MQAVIIATAKVIALIGILIAIARVRHPNPLDDPFFDTQNWELSDAYKLIVPIALLSYLQSIIYHLLLDRMSDYWLLWFCMTSGGLAFIATYAIYYWVIKKPHEIRRTVLGLDKAKFWNSGVIHLNIAVIVLLLVITDYKHPAISTNTTSPDMNLMIAVTLGLVVTIFLWPVLEEILFRGVAYTPVARRIGRWKSIGLLSLTVVLSHSHYEVTNLRYVLF
ncbi:MAG TPA: CPBP family glutamic-type intramembrane protease [Desulfomonilaceae bacterium]|nr:CPBP family glutamic-type intramembrane protease [Desulfomonilaceae bacterium]